MLEKPVGLAGSIKLPGFPATLVATLSADGKPDVLDQPDDEPEEGERLFLYAFASVAFLDYRGKDRAKSGRYGFYFHVPEGEYRCADCGNTVQSPPSWPFVRCTVRRSGFHRLDVPVPSVMDMDVKG